ncbi:hypothetical protein Lal_00003355 [Lupinus albus]|nr:hypothetical protein Lal_00003355 [Lupinus albus]
MEHWRAMKKQQWRLKEMEGDEALCGSMELTQPKVREKTIVVLEYFIIVIISDFPQESQYVNVSAIWLVGPLVPGDLSFMSELDAQIPTTFDPFAEANAEDSGAGTKDYVHIRIQQRNGRKSLTTVQGLKKEFSYNKILKDLKKEFCCNGTVVQDPELGQVIQLQGDQRKNVSTFLVQAGIVKKDHIKIHGF